MGKKREQKVGKPTKSFEDQVSDMVQSKVVRNLELHFKKEFYRFSQAISANIVTEFANIFTRLSVVEDLVKKSNKIKDDEYLDLLAAKEDEVEGFKPLDKDAVVKEGDRVRMQLEAKLAGSKEFRDEGKKIVNDVGSGQTLLKELEVELIGMKVGEVKELAFGKEKEYLARLTVNKVSVKKEVKNDKNA